MSRTTAQLGALVFGAVYTLVGLAGFLVTGFGQFAGVTGKHLLIFEINPLHNVVHLLIGVLGLALAAKPATARTYGWLLFGGYGLVFLYGLFAVNRTDGANFLSLNGSDNGLHLLTAVVGLAIALLPDRRTVSAR